MKKALMKKTVRQLSPLVFIAILFLAGCSENKNASTHKQTPEIYTVNYPLAFFAEQIAGDQANVVFPEMEGDPAFWQPSAEQVANFQNADLILLNGASYAKWLAKVSLPESRLLDTSATFSERFIRIEDATSHSHGPGGEHTHGETAFTTWLDLTQAVQQAAAINTKLDLSNSGFDKLKNDLLKLDKEWESEFAKLSGQPLLGSHPVYQYLTRRYELNLKSVHWEPDVAPDQDMWNELKTLLSRHPAKIMLWEGEPLPETKAVLEKMGIQSIVFDPCGNRPAEGNFLSTMKQNLSNLKSRP